MRSLSDFRRCQHEAVPFLLNTPKCALWAQPGLGKTGAALRAATLLLDRLEVSRVLVIAPIAVAMKTWPDAIHEWEFSSTFEFAHLAEHNSFGTWTGPGHRRLAYWSKKLLALEHKYEAEFDEGKRHKLLREIRRARRAFSWGQRVAGTTAPMQLINWHNLAWLVHFWGAAWPYDMVIHDEASIGLKNGQKSLLWRALERVTEQTKRMVQLTGTPTPRSLENIWGQMRLLDGGKRLGRHVTPFRMRFFKESPSGWGYIPREGALEAVLDNVRDLVLVQKSADYLDLPETIYSEIPVELDDSEWQIYKRFLKQFIAEIDGADITAINAGALRVKLRQLANGLVYDEDRFVRRFHSRKIEAMRDYIDEREGENVLCFYWFKHDLEAILKEFPEAKVYDSSIENDWNAGRIPLMLLHPNSGGHGLNIQYGARRMLWFGAIDDFEVYDQSVQRLAEARAVGLGATFVDHLIVRGSIEDKVMSDLQRKSDAQNEVLDYLNRLKAQLS
jgi:hypothetical protein